MCSIDFQKWDEQVDDPKTDKNKLYNELKGEEIKNESNHELLYRLAKVSLYLSKLDEIANRKDKQKQRSIEALGYSEKACTLSPDKAECHKWYCASLGAMTTVGTSNKEKIKYGHLFKEHADIALKLQPDDPLMVYMYGRWCFEVASLSWFEKKFAKAFYGSVPTAHYIDAFEAFKKASQIREKWIECHLGCSIIYRQYCCNKNLFKSPNNRKVNNVKKLHLNLNKNAYIIASISREN